MTLMLNDFESLPQPAALSAWTTMLYGVGERTGFGQEIWPVPGSMVMAAGGLPPRDQGRGGGPPVKVGVRVNNELQTAPVSLIGFMLGGLGLTVRTSCFESEPQTLLTLTLMM